MDWKFAALLCSLFLFGVLENLFPFFTFKQGWAERIQANFSLGILNVLATSFTTTMLLKWVWQQKDWAGVFHAIPSPWLIFVLSVLVLDCYIYFWHRMMHSVSIAWRFHQVHHTERAMNISTAYRFHAVEVILSNLPKIFLIWFLGIPPVLYLIYETLYTAELVFHHSNWKLPYRVDRLLSHVVVTPNYHRLHHSQILAESRSNYASFLSIWDRLFNSQHYPRSPKNIELGLPHATQSDIVGMILSPFRSKP